MSLSFQSIWERESIILNFLYNVLSNFKVRKLLFIYYYFYNILGFLRKPQLIRGALKLATRKTCNGLGKIETHDLNDSCAFEIKQMFFHNFPLPHNTVCFSGIDY